MNPAGGLARRKTTVEKARAAGPVLLLDAGNALFKVSQGLRPEDRGAGAEPLEARAQLILKAMGEMGTVAMAAGSRDLSLGAGFLKAAAAKAKVPVLSANLVGADKKLLFPASLVATAGGLKVGLVGVSPMGVFPGTPSVTGEAPVKAVLAEAKKLRPHVDLVVVLAAVPFADALQLSKEGGKDVDFILQSHDARGVGPALKGDGNFVLPTGERGRTLVSLALTLDGKGPFVDLSEADRQKQTVEILDRQLEEVKKRFEAAKDPEAKKSLQETLKTFQARREEAKKAAGMDLSKSARTLKLEFINLGSDVKDDPALKAQVEKLEPPGTASH